MKNSEKKFIFLLTVFISSLSVINILGSKIVTLGPFTFGIMTYAYALTFPCTDVVAEVWGKARARFMVLMGFVAYGVTMAFVVFSVEYPPAEFWIERDGPFREVLGAAPRIMLASVAAYLAAQFHDLWAFHFWKKVTKGKHLWLRNNMSTMTSQLVDTIIFVLVAFYGVFENSILMTMIFGQYVLKLIIATIDTPIVYLLVKWITGKWEVHGDQFHEKDEGDLFTQPMGP